MNITKEQIKEWLLSRSTPENEILPLMVDVIHDCVKDLSPKWVSVDKSYPEKLDIVLITDGENYDTVMYFHDAYLGTPFVRKATHWMPLTPPK